MIELLLATQVTVDGCDDGAEIERIAAIELGSDPKPASVRCAGSLALLQLGDRTRSIDLSSVDVKARPRLVALTLAELASTSVAIGTDPDPKRAIEVDYRAEILGTFLAFTAASPPSFGGRAAFTLSLFSSFGGRIDVHTAFGSEAVPLGRASLLTAGAGLSAFGRIVLDPVEIDLGAGGRAAWARLAGSPSDPAAIEGATISGAWSGPFIEARIAVGFARFAATIAFELGLVVLPISGQVAGETVIAADGAWVSISLGVGFGS